MDRTGRRLGLLAGLAWTAAFGCAAAGDPLYGTRPSPRAAPLRFAADPPRPQVVVALEPPPQPQPPQETPPAPAPTDPPPTPPADPATDPPADPPTEPRDPAAPSSDAPAAPRDPVDRQREQNELAFEGDYLRQKERLFPDHAGQWIAIVAGRLLPIDSRGRLAPTPDYAACLAAADAADPAALHRFLFRIGEEGDVVYSDGYATPRTMVGAALKQRFAITSSFDAAARAILWTRAGRSARFAVEREQIELRLSDPAGRAVVVTRVADSASFGGFLALEATFAGLLDAEKHEIPGRVLLRTGAGLEEARRARVRLAVPELELDELLPAAVWGD
ncbi:MAG: hypothetical protein JNL90_05940 [Planctomycetes bacterium]|nr:hypothetical protein [Planctomycetota bacterium]